jgi:8-oxo-dGTP pyrophosphatase MutT (NUDIX family)
MSRSIAVERIRRALASHVGSELERPRRAAVALVVAPAHDSADALSLLLVRRSERPGDPWSGHMALPGGHAHRDDTDLLHTARRETLEEVGIELASAELLGQLDDVSPLRVSDISVRPFVFFIPERKRVTLSAEVTEAVWVPLDALASDALRGRREVVVQGKTLDVPAFIVDERVVWGMTFHLLERFVAKVFGHGRADAP